MKDTKPNDAEMPKILGLTGGIAAGKSTVRRAFESRGVPCLDLDIVARSIHQDPAHPATRDIAKAFAGWMTADGALQRGSLRAFFARDTKANHTLIGILTPHVLAKARQWTRAQRATYVVWESALLLQASMAVDHVLVIQAPAALRIARVRTRNPDWSPDQVADLVAMQWTLQPAPSTTLSTERTGATTDTLCNNGSPEQLQDQVQQLHQH